jgi:hypothetical protein
MLFPAGSNYRLASSQSSASADEIGLPRLLGPGLLFRLTLWLLRVSGQYMSQPLPVRVYYKFDAGCWRSRNTLQLHKVYRCR